jgi:hypothetical protein
MNKKRVRVGWWVYFIQPNDLGEIPFGFYIDDVRAKTFNKEPGYLKHVLKPCYIEIEID